MKQAFYLFIAVALLISCSFKIQPKVKVFEIASFGEVFMPGQKTIAVLENNIKIADLGDYRLYITPYIKTKSKLTFDDDDNVIDQKLISTDTTYEVLAINRNEKKGLRYTLENFRNEKGKVMGIDTFMEEVELTEATFKTFDYDLGVPASVTKNGTKKIERFGHQKVNYAEADSIYRYYDSDLQDINFSFSERLDKENGSKLYKTTFVFNKIPKGVLLPDTEIPR